MGAKVGGSKTSQKTNSFETLDQNQKSNQNTVTDGSTNQNTTGGSRAVFDSPQAQQILNALTGQSTGGGPAMGTYGKQAGDTYGKLANTQGGINPAVEGLISAGNAEGDAQLDTGLAKVRAGGYRGGTGASMYGQGKLVADSANTRAKGNNEIRYNAYESGQNRQMAGQTAGAAGLTNLEGMNRQGAQNNANIGTQILALLRGENNNQNTAGTQHGTQAVTAESILKALKEGVSATSGSTFGGSVGFGTGA